VFNCNVMENIMHSTEVGEEEECFGQGIFNACIYQPCIYNILRLLMNHQVSRSAQGQSPSRSPTIFSAPTSTFPPTFFSFNTTCINSSSLLTASSPI
jgi:hypothetical protein